MKSPSDATSWVVVLTAATSLVLMICLYQIDNIVHGTLYSYGLQFSYNWAGPYWRLTQIGFTAGWLNIIIAFTVQLYNIKSKPKKAEQPTAALEKEKKPEEGAKEQKETKPAKPAGEAPTTPQPETQEKREEPQQPEEASEQKTQQPETDPSEIPVLAGL